MNFEYCSVLSETALSAADHLPLAADAISRDLQVLLRLCLSPLLNLGWQEPALPTGLSVEAEQISQLRQRILAVQA